MSFAGSKKLTVGSAFAGIGGFDLGFERAGFKTIWQIENNKYCQTILERHWPKVAKYEDIRDCIEQKIPVPDVLCGGDPCPSRSLAKGNRKSNHPDLAGYFLALAGRLKPRWVLRENVLASDVVDFATALEALGYEPLVVEINSADFTSQHRRREFCIGCPKGKRTKLAKLILDQRYAGRVVAKEQGEGKISVKCITAGSERLAPDDNYVYERGRGLRFLSEEEREAFQGFPRGWTAGLSRSRQCVMIGNAVTVPVIEWIATLIAESDELC